MYTFLYISSNRDAAAKLRLLYCLLVHARCFGMLWLWMLTKYKICGFFHVIKCLDTFNWPHLSNFFCYVANFRVRFQLPQHFPHNHKTAYFYHSPITISKPTSILAYFHFGQTFGRNSMILCFWEKFSFLMLFWGSSLNDKGAINSCRTYIFASA